MSTVIKVSPLYRIVSTQKGFSVVTLTNLEVKNGLRSLEAAKVFARRMQIHTPFTPEEHRIYGLMANRGYNDVEFRQRWCYGRNYFMLVCDSWAKIDDRTLEDLKDINPTATQVEMFDQDKGWQYHVEFNHAKADRHAG